MNKISKNMAFKRFFKPLLALALICVLLLGAARGHLSAAALVRLQAVIQASPYGPLLYVLIYIAGVVSAVPGVVLTALAGPLFGFWKGALLVILGANLGCQLTFFISRFFGQAAVRRFIKEDSLADRISKRIEDNGFLFMLYLRLIPIFPFNGVNYASGLTNIRYRDYTLATFFGMIPGILVYVNLSAAAAGAGRDPAYLAASLLLMAVFTALTICVKKRQSRRGAKSF